MMNGPRMTGDGWAWIAGLMAAVILATAPAVRDTTPTPPDGPCNEWYTTAAAAGWPDTDWPTLAAVMFCESRCDPAARNPSGASGLLQIMPGWWRGRDPFDPATNLAIGREVHDTQGWRAWSCYP
jgi:hypothetical protein